MWLHLCIKMLVLHFKETPKHKLIVKYLPDRKICPCQCCLSSPTLMHTRTVVLCHLGAHTKLVVQRVWLGMFSNQSYSNAAIPPQEALLLLLRRKLCKGVRVLFHALLHCRELLHAFPHLLKRPFAIRKIKTIFADHTHNQNDLP